MVDIFEDPKVYSVDVKVKATIPTRGNKSESMTIEVKSEPLTLIGGKIASKEIRDRFLHRVYKRKINRSEYEKIKFEIISIKVNKFLTNLCYKFDFSNH